MWLNKLLKDVTDMAYPTSRGVFRVGFKGGIVLPLAFYFESDPPQNEKGRVKSEKDKENERKRETLAKCFF